MSKQLLGILSVLFVVATGGPYIWSIIKGETKPHLFTWVVWTLIYVIVSAAQYSGGAGPGMWAAASGCLFVFVVVILAIRYGERNITTSDWFAFIGAICAIPVWYATKNPMWAVILVTAIDGLGFYPTFRKSWSKPQQELAYMYIMDAIRYCLALFAMETYSVTTTLTPVFVVISNTALVSMLFWRRYRLNYRA